MKHFTMAELCASQTANKRGIMNVPTSIERERLINLVEKIADPTRDYMGIPIFCSSGFRSVELNRAAGGAIGSQHTKGEAIDLTCHSRVLNKKMFDFIKDNLEFDQLINEYDYSWIHVSLKMNQPNRKQVLNIK